MKISLFLTEDVVQFNLTPENEHEMAFMKLLQAYRGEAEIHAGIDLGNCLGGYVRSLGKADNVTAITIRKRVPKLEGAAENKTPLTFPYPSRDG